MAKNSPPPAHRICLSCQPSLTTQPPPTIAISVHSTWPSTPPSTMGRADGALGWDVRRRKENWEWSPISVASDIKYVWTNSEAMDDEAEWEEVVAAETGLSADSAAAGCCSPLQLSRYVSYSICSPKNTQAADATPLSTVSPQLVNTVALTLDSTALSTANVAAAAFDPNSSVRLAAEKTEDEAGREDDRNRVDRKVLSPNSAMKMRHSDDTNDDKNDSDEAGETDDDSTVDDDAETEEEKEGRDEEEAAVVMGVPVRLCSATREDSTAMATRDGEDDKNTSDEEWTADEEMEVKRRARGRTEAERSSGL